MNDLLVKFGDGITLGTGAVDVYCLLVIALLQHQACHANMVAARHHYWKLSLAIKIGLATVTFGLHFFILLNK